MKVECINMKVKCINKGRYNRITEGHIYEAIGQYKTTYIIKSDTGNKNMYSKKLFEIVCEDDWCIEDEEVDEWKRYIGEY